MSLILLILFAISTSSVAAAPAGTKDNDVIRCAKSWIGVLNVHGGNGRAGIDCSHLVYQVYKQSGAKGIYFMKVPEIKKSKYYTETTSPKPGDLVLWKKNVITNGKTYCLAARTGIWIGDGQFIHTSRDKRMVVIDSISQSPYKDGQPYYVRWSWK